MKKFWRVVLSRTFLFAILALVQIAFFAWLITEFSRIGTTTYTILTILSVLVIVLVFEKDDINPAYRMMWMMIVVVLPITGAAFYLLWGNRNIGRKKSRVFAELEARGDSVLQQDEAVLAAFTKKETHLAPMARYLAAYANPLYADTACEYYAWGEEFFPRFIEELQKAKKYVFLEYFIIDEGEMWDKTLAILKEKAAAGVDVRVAYDFVGSLFTLDGDYPQQLRAYGIQCEAFNPIHFSWHISDYTLLNHRNHRKVAVIDGNVGFTGGLNFADEYINKRERFGIWKDTAFLLRGPGVYSLTVTFLKTWDYMTGGVSALEAYRPSLKAEADCCVQPYADTPIDAENISESAYLHVINHTKEYVYITTPYLVIDHEMMTALTLAAKSGIDVRIITPGIPDKWYVYYVTQSYYKVLLQAGVRIYEFTPGFLHAKMYVSDDKTAIVGSANMDYRSLYLHFENCCAFYGGHMVKDVKADMLRTFEKSHEITMQDVDRTGLVKRLLQLFFRFFSPML